MARPAAVVEEVDFNDDEPRRPTGPPDWDLSEDEPEGPLPSGGGGNRCGGGGGNGGEATPPRRHTNCPQCGGDHRKGECPTVDCWSCGGMGHMQFDCPSNPEVRAYKAALREYHRKRRMGIPEEDLGPPPQRPSGIKFLSPEAGERARLRAETSSDDRRPVRADSSRDPPRRHRSPSPVDRNVRRRSNGGGEGGFESGSRQGRESGAQGEGRPWMTRTGREAIAPIAREPSTPARPPHPPLSTVTALRKQLLTEAECKQLESAAFRVLPAGNSAVADTRLFWRQLNDQTNRIENFADPPASFERLLQPFIALADPLRTAGVVERPLVARSTRRCHWLLVLLRGQCVVRQVSRGTEDPMGSTHLTVPGTALWVPALANDHTAFRAIQLPAGGIEGCVLQLYIQPPP